MGLEKENKYKEKELDLLELDSISGGVLTSYSVSVRIYYKINGQSDYSDVTFTNVDNPNNEFEIIELCQTWCNNNNVEYDYYLKMGNINL